MVRLNKLAFSKAATILYSTVRFTNCSFSGGLAYEGGAIYMKSSNVNFYNSSLFYNNSATKKGGALYAIESEITFYGINIFEWNTILHMSNTQVGGGGAIFLDKSEMKFICPNPRSATSIKIKESSMSGTKCFTLFKNNLATQGGALYLGNSNCHLSGKIEFIRNKAFNFHGGAIYSAGAHIMSHGYITITNNCASYYGGGLYFRRSDMESLKMLTFKSNSAIIGGGVYLDDRSSIVLIEEVNFFENKADEGGGIAFKSSQLKLRIPVTVTFLNNHANYGGAIIIINKPLDTKLCYEEKFKVDCVLNIQTKGYYSHSLLKKIRFNFTYNTAVKGGSNIFGGALEHCQVRIYEGSPIESGLNFLKKYSIFKLHNNENSSISSYPIRACFCNEGILNNCFVTSLRLPHGKSFNVSVVAVGQTMTPVPSQILHSFASNDNSELLRKTYSYNETSRRCHNITFQLFSTNQQEVFDVYPAQCTSEISLSRVTVKFIDCPPGFELDVNTCDCEERLMKIIGNKKSCDIETGLIKRPRKTWMKSLFDENNSYSGFMWSPTCPSLLCKVEKDDRPLWLNFSSSYVDNLCQENRTGIMCGACKRNYSLTLNDLNCSICGNEHTTLLIFFMAAGIALIFMLLLLRITIASGTINALILYVNVVNISQSIYFPVDKTKHNL